jgi:glyoxylase-like metal-dependent hydrolase (beta-lactamase superfamily II)
MRRVNWIVALVGLGLASGAACAENGFGVLPVPPAAKSFNVGTIKLTALHDAQYVVPNDGKTFGVGVDPAAVGDVLRAAGAPTDRISLSVNALLVRTGRRVLLIDTGMGSMAHGSLVASLHEDGVSPKAVTDILLTHSHGDHIGGLLDANGGLEFPKATIRMASVEWSYMQKSGPAKAVAAISGHVRTFEPGAQIAPGVTSVALAGHTPGHVGYEIVSRGSRLLDIGDLAHSSIVSLQKPEWAVQFDHEDAVAKTTRLATLTRLAKDQELVYTPHFPFPGVGHIVAQGSGFAWKAGIP